MKDDTGKKTLSPQDLNKLRYDSRLQGLADKVDPKRRFSLFDVLGQTDYEIRHSNVLAWLLTPHASHGLSHLFLGEFCSAIGLPDSLRAQFIADQHISVEREKKYVDIIISSKLAKAAIIIENKVWSEETPGQLEMYRKRMEHDLLDYEVRKFVFLTLDGKKPTDDKWTPLSYKRIYEILSSHVNNCLLKNKRVADFLVQYLELLEQAIFPGHLHDEKVQALLHDHEVAIAYLSEKAAKDPAKIEGLENLDIDTKRAIALLLRARGQYQDILFDYFRNSLAADLGLIKRGFKDNGYFVTADLQRILEKVNPSYNKDRKLLDNNLLYLFSAGLGETKIVMYLYPGRRDAVRESFENMIKSPNSIFHDYTREGAYYRVFDHTLLDENDYSKSTIEKLKKRLKEKLIDFKKTKAASIEKYIAGYLTKYPPNTGKFSPTDKICALAESNGVGESFRSILNSALKQNLYPKVYANRVQYAPPQNHNGILFHVWAEPDDDKMLTVYAAPKSFAQYFSIRTTDAISVLGEGYLYLDEKAANKFAANLDLLLRNAKPKILKNRHPLG